MSLSAMDSAHITIQIIQSAERQIAEAMPHAGHSDAKIFWAAQKELASALKILSHIPTKNLHENEAQRLVETMRARQAMMDK